MQKLRKFLPVILVLALAVTAFFAMAITGSAENTTVENVWLVSTPHQNIRTYANIVSFNYYPDTTVQATANSNALLGRYNNGWGATNCIATAPITTGTEVNTKTTAVQVTIYKLADSVDRRAVDALFGLPVKLTIDTTTNEVVDVSVQGTMKAVTTTRIDATNSGGTSTYLLDGVDLSYRVNQKGRRIAYNTSGGGYFRTGVWQTTYNTGRQDLGQNDTAADSAVAVRYRLVNEVAPDIMYLVDTDNDGYYDWSFCRSVMRGTLSTVNPGTQVSFTFPAAAAAANGNNYTATGFGGSAWFVANTTKHYFLGEQYDAGAEAGKEYYATGTLGAYAGLVSEFDLFEVGNAVDDNFSSLSIKSGSIFKTLEDITVDMIDARVLVYDVAEAIPELTSVEVTGEGQVTVTGTFLDETITGTIDGIEIITCDSLRIVANELILSNASVAASQLTVYAVYSNGSEDLLPESAYTVAPVADTDNQITVTAVDTLTGETVVGTAYLFYSDVRVITATPLHNARGENSTNYSTITADGKVSYNTANSPILIAARIGSYDINKCIAIAPIPSNTSPFPVQTIYEYSGDIEEVTKYVGQPVTVYFADEGKTEMLAFEQLGTRRVFSLKDASYVDGKYFFGAEEVSFAASFTGRQWYMNNGQYMQQADVLSIIKNVDTNSWRNVGNIIAVDTDENGVYDWLYYEAIYDFTQGVTAVSGTNVQFNWYTASMNMPHATDSSVYNWFMTNNKRFGIHGGLTTVQVGDAVYGKVLLDVTGISSAAQCYLYLYSAAERFYPVVAEPQGTTVEKSYIAGNAIEAADLPLVYVERTDGSTAYIRLTDEQITSDLTLAEEDTEKEVVATVDGREISFTVSGFTITAAPTKVTVTVAANAEFVNGMPIDKSLLTVKAYYGSSDRTGTVIAASDYDIVSGVADIDNPTVTVSFLGVEGSKAITVVKNIKNYVFLATYTHNVRTQDNKLAANATNVIAVYPYGTSPCTTSTASIYEAGIMRLTLADNFVADNALCGLPVAVELDVNGDVCAIEQLGTTLIIRAADLTHTDIIDEDGETVIGYNFFINGAEAALNPELYGNNASAYLLNASSVYRAALPSIINGIFSGVNDNLVTLVDVDGDGAYDFARSEQIYNGSEVYAVETFGDYQRVKVGGSAGSIASTGWITYDPNTTAWFVYELADGVAPLEVGDYVNYKLICDSTLTSANIGFQSGGHGGYPTKLAITSKATVIEGFVTNVQTSSTKLSITFNFNGEPMQWTTCASGVVYADGLAADLYPLSGRATFASNKTYKLVLSENGYVVRSLDPTETVNGLEASCKVEVFGSASPITADKFDVFVTYPSGSKVQLTDFALSASMATVGMESVTVTATADGTEYNVPVAISVVDLNIVTRTYFQISNGTTASSESTSVRFVAGVTTLDHLKVGFVFSLNDTELSLEYLTSDTFANLNWVRVIQQPTYELLKAKDTATNKTYFILSTTQVFDSINADNAVITADDLSTGYLFAVTFTGVPNAYFNTPFTARTFAKGGGVTEYSSEVISRTVSEMLQ